MSRRYSYVLWLFCSLSACDATNIAQQISIVAFDDLDDPCEVKDETPPTPSQVTDIRTRCKDPHGFTLSRAPCFTARLNWLTRKKSLFEAGKLAETRSSDGRSSIFYGVTSQGTGWIITNMFSILGNGKQTLIINHLLETHQTVESVKTTFNENALLSGVGGGSACDDSFDNPESLPSLLFTLDREVAKCPTGTDPGLLDF